MFHVKHFLACILICELFHVKQLFLLNNIKINELQKTIEYFIFYIIII